MPRARLIAATCERRDQRRPKIESGGVAASAPLLSPLTIDKPDYLKRFEGCRTDHPRRRRPRQSMLEGSVLHVANLEPRAGVPAACLLDQRRVTPARIGGLR